MEVDFLRLQSKAETLQTESSAVRIFKESLEGIRYQTIICVCDRNLMGINWKLLLKKNVHSYRWIKAGLQHHFIIVIVIIMTLFGESS